MWPRQHLEKKDSWQTNGTLTFVAVLHTTVVGFLQGKLPRSNLTARFSWCNITAERELFLHFQQISPPSFKFPNLSFQRKDSDGGACVIGEKMHLDKEIQTEHPLTLGSCWDLWHWQQLSSAHISALRTSIYCYFFHCMVVMKQTGKHMNIKTLCSTQMWPFFSPPSPSPGTSAVSGSVLPREGPPLARTKTEKK